MSADTQAESKEPEVAPRVVEVDTRAWAARLAKHFGSFCDALGGEDAVAALPVLDLGRRGGHTDYIDFLQPEELTANVMIGVDAWRRSFVAFRLQVEGKPDMVMTLFERYSDDHFIWAWGTYGWAHESSICDELIGSDHRMRPDRPESTAKLFQLLQERRLALSQWTISLAL